MPRNSSGIDEFAKDLQAYLPTHIKDNELEKRYESFKGVLALVYPWKGEDAQEGETLQHWAEEVLDILLGSASVAITATHPVVLDLAGAVLAEAIRNSGSSLGALIAPAAQPKNLIEIAAGARICDGPCQPAQSGNRRL